MDLNRKKFTTKVGGEELTIEVSNIASQANGSVIATYGGTTVLATAVISRKDKDVDYMPLAVDYEEKFYAAGKIIGSRFIRREGRPSESAILSGRLIDRTIRPLFDSRIRKEMQVVATVLSYDEENDPDFVALMAASAALSISDIPFNGPVAGLRIAKMKGSSEIMINPKNSLVKPLTANIISDENLEFDAFVSGLKGRINMVELAGSEAKKEHVIEAYKKAISEFENLIDFQNKIVKEVGKPKMVIEFKKPDEKLAKAVENFLGGKLEGALFNPEKGAIYALHDALKADLVKQEFDSKAIAEANHIYEDAVNELLHKEVLTSGRRPDGRKTDQVRDLHAEVGILPRTHGSGLFVRGNTQALAVTTLASPGSEQIVETMELNAKKRFMLHYNFPPYSVGEARSFRGPGRRDIGHGALAEKAIMPLIPKSDVFPYTVRVVSEILSSNGSSSMATVSATSLSLMDAGVPLKSPAAGIAMGVIIDESTFHSDKMKYKVLTDIQGAEDHHGDMDFKVAGTKDGINAIQMDVKVVGVSVDILTDAMNDAEKARLHILETTNKVIGAPRAELSKYAPRVLIYNIDPSRIGELIGPGGKVINGIIAKTGATAIDIEEDGKVFITAQKVEVAEAALAEVKAIFKEYKIGEFVEGPVVRILEFGAIVDLGNGRDGMIHVSELKDGFVKKVEDVVKVGDFVRAKIVKVENGKIGLSLKQAK